jgi:hypothetical protein
VWRYVIVPSLSTRIRSSFTVHVTAPLARMVRADDIEIGDPPRSLSATLRRGPPSRTCAGSARALPATTFAQLDACRWGVSEGFWLPPGAWQTCVGPPAFTDGDDIWIGVDVGGERSATAILWVNEHLPVGAAICHGDPGVLEGVDHVRALARHASEAIARHGRLEAERRASQDAIS